LGCARSRRRAVPRRALGLRASRDCPDAGEQPHPHLRAGVGLRLCPVTAPIGARANVVGRLALLASSSRSDFESSTCRKCAPLLADATPCLFVVPPSLWMSRG